MSPDLQRLIDGIASSLKLPALLEDASHALLAYSRHDEKIDEVRERTILGREAGPDVAAWLAGHAIGRAERPIRIPANPDLAMLPRLCLPVRRRDDLLGYLWFVETDGRLPDDFVRAAEVAAAHLADTLWDAQELNRRHVSVILARIAEGVEPSTSDLMALADQGVLVHAKYRLVCLASTSGGQSTPVSGAGLRSVGAAFAPWSPVFLDPHDESCFLLQVGSSDVLAAQDLAEAVLSRFPDLAIGLGDTVDSIGELAQSFDSARHAVTCARLFPDLGPVLDWEKAGMFRLVPDLARSPRGASALIDGFDDLLVRPDFEPLMHTVEVYLDSGCNAQTASVDLMLHRTSLYYRIQRFETLTGINLRHGVQRTNAHVAIKVARFRAGWSASRDLPAVHDGRSVEQLSGWTR